MTKTIDLKIYDHGNCKTIAIEGLTEKQYRNTYLRACNKFNQVNQNNVTLSWVNGLYYGYLICTGE